MDLEAKNAWWSELKQNGMLISPTVLDEFLPDGPIKDDGFEFRYNKLRDAYTKFQAWSREHKDGEQNGLYRWIDAVLESFLGYNPPWWKKEQDIPDRFRITSITHDVLRPNRVLFNHGMEKAPKFVLRIDKESQRLGIGRSRVEHARLLEILRGSNHPVGILTNGHQFRLVYAGIDYDCWVEWEAERWFEDEMGLEQLIGFLSLCGPNGTEKQERIDYPLNQAIIDSRSRQGELSQVMGEQTRLAVEELLSALDRAARANPEVMEILKKDPITGKPLTDTEQLEALYHGAIRLVMRIVVLFFSEARELMPRSSEMYHGSYGVEGLFAQLKITAAEEGVDDLEGRHHSWPRLLALFRLVHEGCAFSDLPIPNYGGTLFRRGDPKSQDPILRTLAIFEDPRIEINDATVLQVLRLLKIGKVKAKKGRSYQWVSGPVDFSDLRTEYIGMMYEGLLDYTLRKVPPEQEAVIFLNMGQQPALPFSLLKSMDDKALKDLLSKLIKEKAGSIEGKDEDDEGEKGEVVTGEEGKEENHPDEEEPSGETSEDEEPQDAELADNLPYDERNHEIIEWAKLVVELAGLSKKLKGKKYSVETIEREKEKAAQRIILKIIGPGEMYLIRASGTRKGSGTFYTKPQLAVPTVYRTLEPLVYNVTQNGTDRKLVPKKPEEILGLKVCDPAMGSGSFLVASLRYMSDVLYESLWYHKLIKDCGNETVITLPFGITAEGKIREDLIPCRTSDARFELMAKAKLKRYVVERCIYGVDINPLAVELAKLALWVETMDRELPFTFLNHKLKVGNSLVGCWFDRFQEYPVMAWMREGGDKDHKGIHYEKGTWSKAIKKTLDERVKPELVRIIQGQTRIDEWEFKDEKKVMAIHDRAVSLFEELHNIPIHGDGYAEREEFYRDRILKDPEINRLNDAFDAWCAIWFWPGDELVDNSNAPTPERFYNPTTEFIEKVKSLASKYKFLHWELEFPEVFVSGKGGFDAIVGNPPWEISKPNSKEFFTLHDPIYRTYGKQEALTHQSALFMSHEWIEKEWIHYCSYFKAMSNWTKNSAFPFGDSDDEVLGGNSLPLVRGKENLKVHLRWRGSRIKRVGYADLLHPFRYQGSADINTYKMFLELAHTLSRTNGRFGIIVPSGIYIDNGTMTLRELFINKCKWEWLFGFENRKKVFEIDSRFKFCPIIIEKGGTTGAILTAFMRHDLSDWANPWPIVIPYSKEQIYRFCPKSKAILEIRTKRNLEVLEKIYKNSVLLGDQGPNGWQIQFVREFDMTNDSPLFPPRLWWEEKGYKPDQYGRWLPPEGKKPELIYKGKEIGPPGDVALPLYQGVMIWQYDFAFNKYIEGSGTQSVWEELDWSTKSIQSQYLMPISTMINIRPNANKPKFVMRNISSPTNQRTLISTILPGYPCGNKVSRLHEPSHFIHSDFFLLTNLNSYCLDFVLREKFAISGGGGSLVFSTIEDLPLLIKGQKKIIEFSMRLSIPNIAFSTLWYYFSQKEKPRKSWRLHWAITLHERLRLQCILDAVVAELYGLDYANLALILRDCAWPVDKIRALQQGLDPKGFWRVAKNIDPELRHSVLTLRAFADLKTIIEKCGGDQDAGITEFCEANDGEGWMIPERISFIQREDGMIEFDTSDSKSYEVRSRMGERFLPWQLEGTPEESWKECEMHARNILGEEAYEEFIKNIGDNSDNLKRESNVKSLLIKAEKQSKKQIKNNGNQKDLFQF